MTTSYPPTVSTVSLVSLLKAPKGSAATTSSASLIRGGVAPNGKRITPCPEIMLGVVTPYLRRHKFPTPHLALWPTEVHVVMRGKVCEKGCYFLRIQTPWWQHAKTRCVFQIYAIICISRNTQIFKIKTFNH